MMLLRPILPNWLGIGVAVANIPEYRLCGRPSVPTAVPVGAIHGASGFPVTTTLPITVGVTVLPTPVIALVVRTMFTGLPLCSVPMVASVQPVLRRLPL